MKARMYYFAGIIFLSLLFFQSFKTINSGVVNKENTEPEKKFLITAMHSGFDPSNQCNEEFSSSGYSLLKDTLHFNAWHRYGCWFDGDQWFGDPLLIEQGISNTISQNEQRDLATVFDRPITRYLAYGQRSDYQCENIPTGEDYYFHAFETSVTNTYVSDIPDNTAFGGGAIVKFCSLNASGPGVWQGYLVKDLRSNREQCNRIIDHTRDDTYNWYLKPRIRIDTTFANNPSNQNTRVCKVEVINWNGDIVKIVDIKVKNFKNLGVRYSGEYIDDYYFAPYGDPSNFNLNPTDLCPTTTPMKNAFRWDDDIRTDFRVYWYGECEMFLDYIRVENEPANKLFNVNNIDHDWLRNRLASEIHLAADASNSSPNNFYNEEFEFNMTPSTQELSKIIDSISQSKLSLMVNINMDMYNVHVPHYETIFEPADFKKYLLDSSKIKIILPNPYYLEGWEETDTIGSPSKNPNTLPVYSHWPGIGYDKSKGLLTYPVAPSVYENWLQYNLDDNPSYYNFKTVMKKYDEISKLSGVDIIDLHQSHMWWQNNHKLKEPTNEELELTANLALTYGSKGFMYFAYYGVCTGNGYQTDYTIDTLAKPPMFSAGFVDKNKNKRDINAYGQNKWSFYKRYDRLLEKWGTYLVKFDNSKRSSYIYRKPEERQAMNSDGHFVNEIFTYKLQTDGSVSNTPEPINERFLQAAFFDSYTHLDPPPNPPERYFMIVNRRCSPFIDNSSSDNIGGKRLIKMSIHPFSLWFKKYRNVSLQDLSDNSIVTTFHNENNVNIDVTLDLGWFTPGEAKLFKLAPALCVGGSLVADEDTIRNMEFTCEGQVNTNGKTVLISDSTTINFTPSGRITVNGGTLMFYSVYYPANYPAVKLKGLNGQTWGGISLNNCEAVIFNTVFENTTGQAILSINSNLYLENCSFNITSRAIQYSNTGSSALDAYIKNCKFNITNTSATQCNFIGNAAGMVELNIDGNEFITTSGSVALYISSGFGKIKNNKINQYTYGIYLSNSTTDIYNNVINSGQNDSRGISAVAMSRINLGIDGQGNITGGMDSINLTGQNANDIYVSNSTFNIHRGYNNFNVNSSGSFHLMGTFPQSNTRDYPTIYSRNNCFNLSNTHNNAIHSVFWENSNNTQVSFFLTPYSCDKIVNEEVKTVTDLENGFIDTIKKAIDIETEISSIEQSLYDSLSFDLRTLDFQNASGTSKTLISLYADSANANEKVLDAVTKLYSSVLSVDSANNSSIEQLKTFFESMILNHPDNSELIAKIFYYIQKCKVILEDYASSINGFQQIIDADPYSYEALIASWDLDATRLLDSTSGNGGGESNSELTEEALKKKYSGDDPYDRYDTKKFTKEDRKLIRENVYNSQKTVREINNENFKKLEKRISEGEATKNEKKEYENKKVLKETAKPKNPGTIEEHINNVSNDLSKVLGISNEGSVNDKISSMNPYEYNLSQNYPNPFNPITHLEFGISNLGLVSLKVYDVLGREIKTLVNEIKTAGRYKIEFDGNNFASGVYFYRLEAGDFVQTKRMVLIK